MSRAEVISRIAHDACVEAPRSPLGPRWWDELDERFADASERFSLGARDRAAVAVGHATDVVLRTAAASLVATTALPLGFNPVTLYKSLGDRDFYGPMAESHDPTRFFKSAPRGVTITRKRARMPMFRPSDGVCEDVRFESPYEPVNPRLRKSYLANKNNRFAHARWWRHTDGPRPTIIAVHGFTADMYHLNEWFFALPWLYELGADVMLFTLPFHGARQGTMSPFSGHGFFAGGISHINEAFAQAVFDFRIFMNHLLEREGVPAVGVTGVSLGGFTSALLAAVEPRLAFSLPNVPVVSIADLVLEWEPVGTTMRAALASFGKSIKDARYMLAVSSPLTYKPVLPRERLMVIGGVADRLAPPKHSRLLWEHWGRCRLHWFPGSHIIHLDRGEYLRHTARFLRQNGFFAGLPPKSSMFPPPKAPK